MTGLDASMLAYYAARAREYERIYDKPERQTDLRWLEREIPLALADRQVLEVACGTGYWTQFIASRAARVLATDLTVETLAQAQAKQLDPAVVSFAQADAYALDESLGRFDAAFAGFWWSHLSHAQVPLFVRSLCSRLQPGAKVLLLDNLFVETSSTPISRRDEQGNTYQLRNLADGSTHEVLKNFPDGPVLASQLQGVSSRFEFQRLGYYWLCSWEYSGA